MRICEPCASCGVRCCNRFAVLLTGFDLVRIIKKSGKKAEEFARLEDGENIGEGYHSRVFIFNEEGMKEKVLCLKRKKSMYCIFSMHSKG
ncbi:MAG: hypothetical protein ABIH83_03505, partial [Candidatus Micrarchaeota archaeon]